MPGYKILCVDDEYIALRYLTKLCKNLSSENEVVGFVDSLQALEYAREHEPDIVFLDIDMPKLNGMQLAQKLHALYPKLNIIFITAYEEYAFHALKLDCSGYLLKPVDELDLKHQLEVLRYPKASQETSSEKLVVRCFGEFEVYYQGNPLTFKHKRTKELLAYLIDRRCALVSNKKIIAALWEDDEDHSSYFKNLRSDLINTFGELPFEILILAHGSLGLHTEAIDCDYFDFLNGKRITFNDEYMEQYSWSEETKATLMKIR